MKGKFFLGWVLVFVVWQVGGFLIHGTLLRDTYASLPNLYRGEAEMGRLFPLMILAHVLCAGAFVWIYSRGIEAKPWLAQGIRFGIVVAFLTVIPTYMIYYVVQPMPGALAVRQIVYDGIWMILLGIVAAWVYRPKAA
jgi:hypothetical protein